MSIKTKLLTAASAVNHNKKNIVVAVASMTAYTATVMFVGHLAGAATEKALDSIISE